jgi:hypothetical protein
VRAMRIFSGDAINVATRVDLLRGNTSWSKAGSEKMALRINLKSCVVESKQLVLRVADLERLTGDFVTFTAG